MAELREKVRREVELVRREVELVSREVELVRREVELEIRGAHQQTIGLNNPCAYGNRPLQVSAVFQEQYPNYPDYSPSGDRQQFHPANRPN
jgi:hypothetical protein